jgi:hypothetical protein
MQKQDPWWKERGLALSGDPLRAAMWATSLAQAMRERLPGLRLHGSAELVCNNLLCEKVGEMCLCRLSMCLERMHHLRHLDLRSNKLHRLPEVWTLPALESLDVRDNALTSLPEELSTMPSLRSLRIEGNPINHISPSLLPLITRGHDDSGTSAGTTTEQA